MTSLILKSGPNVCRNSSNMTAPPNSSGESSVLTGKGEGSGCVCECVRGGCWSITCIYRVGTHTVLHVANSTAQKNVVTHIPVNN